MNISESRRACVCQYMLKQTCVSAHTAGCLNIDQSVQHHLHIHSWAFKHWSMYGTSHFQMQSWEWDTHYTTNWYKNTPLANLYNSRSDIETGAFASESDLRIRLTSLLNFNLPKLTNARNTEVSAVSSPFYVWLLTVSISMSISMSITIVLDHHQIIAVGITSISINQCAAINWSTAGG